MEAIQKLIAMNPEYLTSGIPNNVFQLFMQSMQQPRPNAAVPAMQVNPGTGMSATASNVVGAHPSAVTYVQQEDDEADYEEMGVAETYADYWPAKCMSFPSTPIGQDL